MKLKLTITDLCLEVDDTPGPTAQPLNLAPLERLIAELTRTVANFSVTTAPQSQPAAPVVDGSPNIISVTDLTDLSLRPPGEMISLEPAIATSMNGHNPDVIDELQVESSRRLKFADLDKLVRIEMQPKTAAANDGRAAVSLWGQQNHRAGPKARHATTTERQMNDILLPIVVFLAGLATGWILATIRERDRRR